MHTVSVLALALVLAGPGIVNQEPVKKIDDGVLDHIELYAPSLENAKSLTVVIKPFDTSTADLGTGGKNGKEARQEEAKTMQEEGPKVLAEKFASALREKDLFKAVKVAADGDAVEGPAIVIEGKFVTLDPGSRAKRYFAGFGAGKSSVKVTGTVKDATGKMLATFTQRRVGAMGMGGGDSLGKLMSDSRKIGEDIANFVAKWARGDDLN
ncbi:MAG TPA: DUF4410 domain-containing protein [Vicinamibacterales bacterium]|jgi:hypothetical protein|nr:DUF4410 domain-containing protein [Vicinamibacterales bacterium]